MNIRPFGVDQLFPKNRYWDVVKIDCFPENSRELNRRDYCRCSMERCQ